MTINVKMLHLISRSDNSNNISITSSSEGGETISLNNAQGNCILLNSVPEFIETEASLLLTFLLCFYNQLISITFMSDV